MGKVSAFTSFCAVKVCPRVNMYLLNSAQAASFVITPWHLHAPHQISLRHVALLTRAAVMAGTNAPDRLPITAFFIEWMKAVNTRQGS